MEDNPSTFRLWAEVTGDRGDEDPRRLATRLMEGPLPGIDILPPGPQRDASRTVVEALLSPGELEELVRAGYTVTVTGFREGPLDPTVSMADEQQADPLIAKLGAERLRRGGRP